MLKRIFAAILAASAVFAFASCNKTEQTGASGTSTGETLTAPTDGEIDYDAYLPKADFEGYNYRILVRKGYLSKQYLEEDSADNVESAVYRRNKEIEQKYNV